ncbi:hypothetical protein C7M84_012779 [Penaeus vannamei]|uniref:Uncharacterized protein n=1 Tax=Penaeus vannamei TaxID=6689 RepID=A0A3R7QJ19_PENVA|nr:hypothetical protein C7M84_012779 [Penaeus vannamei]
MKKRRQDDQPGRPDRADRGRDPLSPSLLSQQSQVSHEDLHNDPSRLLIRGQRARRVTLFRQMSADLPKAWLGQVLPRCRNIKSSKGLAVAGPPKTWLRQVLRRRPASSDLLNSGSLEDSLKASFSFLLLFDFLSSPPSLLYCRLFNLPLPPFPPYCQLNPPPSFHFSNIIFPLSPSPPPSSCFPCSLPFLLLLASCFPSPTSSLFLRYSPPTLRPLLSPPLTPPPLIPLLSPSLSSSLPSFLLVPHSSQFPPPISPTPPFSQDTPPLINSYFSSHPLPPSFTPSPLSPLSTPFPLFLPSPFSHPLPISPIPPFITPLPSFLLFPPSLTPLPSLPSSSFLPPFSHPLPSFLLIPLLPVPLSSSLLFSPLTPLPFIPPIPHLPTPPTPPPHLLLKHSQAGTPLISLSVLKCRLFLGFK